jgi:hypothetical protein
MSCQAGSGTIAFDPGVAWPTGPMGLLIEAAYHSDPDIASQKWACWKETNPDPDTIDWQTARVISNAATTLLGNSTEPNNLAIQEKLRQFDWTLFENHLRNVRPFLNALVQAQIPVMLTKGAAIHLSGIANGATRLMTDLDILIEPAHIDNVMDVAESLGWKSKRPFSRELFKDRLQSSRHSLPLSNGEKWEVDLHTSAFLLSRCPDHDASMWARSTEARMGDVTVLVPGALDMLVVTLGHGLLSNPRPMGIWVGDAVALIENGAVDWDIFLDEIKRRDLAAFAYTGLEYISQVLGRPVPGYVLTTLASRLCEPFISEFLGHVKHWSATSRTIRQSWGAAAMIRATKWKSRMSSPQHTFLAATPGSTVETSWRYARRQSRTRFVVEIPEGLHKVSVPSLLEIKLILNQSDSPEQLSLALTCFDEHMCELDHWDFPADCPADYNSIPDQLIQFRIDTAIIQAYSLRELGLELLEPDALDASHIDANRVEYRWRN